NCSNSPGIGVSTPFSLTPSSAASDATACSLLLFMACTSSPHDVQFRVERISIRSVQSYPSGVSGLKSVLRPGINGLKSVLRPGVNGLKSVLRAFLPFLFRFGRAEQVADFLEKALALGRHMLLVDLGQLAEKLLLAFGQTLWRLDENGDEQVALAAGTEV